MLISVKMKLVAPKEVKYLGVHIYDSEDNLVKVYNTSNISKDFDKAMVDAAQLDDIVYIDPQVKLIGRWFSNYNWDRENERVVRVK